MSLGCTIASTRFLDILPARDESPTVILKRRVWAALERPMSAAEIAAATGLDSAQVNLAIRCFRQTRQIVVTETRRNTERRGRVVVNVYARRGRALA